MMRIIFLLVVLANLGFFAYAHYLRPPADGGVDPKKLQIAPEKIRLLNAPKAETARAAVACIEWGSFAGPAVARADAAIAELALPEAQVQRVVADASGYWVYLPPVKTRGEADKNIARLKGQGITELSLVLDQSPSRYAVSLGLFKSEDAARKLLAAIKEKGVDTAVMEKRDNLLRQVVFYFKEPGQDVVAKLAELRASIPDSAIKAVACHVAASGR